MRPSTRKRAVRAELSRPFHLPASGGTTETYGYDADGARITKTRAGATTLYLEGIWEETLGQRVKTYYTFNGKAVALRDSTDTTNYPASIHGDHLGSVSVVTNSTGGTVSQEFDPWGNVRSGGTSTTKRNFTGQYLDDTGLLFYNARYYDPAIGRFLSADTIPPDRLQPQSRNRYTYANNHPLKYTDPTGYCGKSTDTKEETEACTKATDELSEYDIHIADLINGLWSSEELQWVLKAVVAMRDALFGGEIAAFRAKIGTVHMHQSAEKTGDAWASGGSNAPAVTEPGFLLLSSTITFYQESFNHGDAWFQRTVVHELAHAWDIHSWGFAGRELRLATKSGWKGHKYEPGGTTTVYGRTGDREDWAESVAETVYNPPSTGGTGIDATREKTVRKVAQ